ncbi:hypothetical protein [Curtobacterium pusillum]|uniref:hypothetical protein n=1 Tax=Curtobacterium pusillum TaxID=69373 RepID=UPI001643C450|nr:hypothetical protein [Curtobacterium pusillum]
MLIEAMADVHNPLIPTAWDIIGTVLSILVTVPIVAAVWLIIRPNKRNGRD